MNETMAVRVEVWPLAADEQGLWLTSGLDAWRPDLPVPADGDVHAEVELVLHRNNALDQVLALHSTSWRPDGPAIMLTYVAVLQVDGPVRRTWPGAEPLSARLPGAVGRPATHGATEPPLPREIDVVLHSLRHLAFLLKTDATVADVLDANWRRHLAEFEPALAGMYGEPHRAA